MAFPFSNELAKAKWLGHNQDKEFHHNGGFHVRYKHFN